MKRIPSIRVTPHALAFWIPFLGSLLVYVFSLPPSVTLEDSGELIVAADHLGIPHPPGYPLWTLLAWGFQTLFGWVTFQGYPNPAWGVAFMSAFFGSLTAGLVGLCTYDLLQSCTGGPETEPPAPPTLNPARTSLIGAGFALVNGLCWGISPSLGHGVLLLGGTGYLLVSLWAGLNQKETIRTHLSPLSQGFRGWAVCSGILLTVFWGLDAPTLPSVLIYTLPGTAMLWLMGWVLQKGLRRALSKGGSHPPLYLFAGSAAGLLLAFTPLMFSQSVIAEVYSLNAFFIALLLYLVLGYLKPPGTTRLCIIVFVFALGLTNHQSLLFLGFFLIAAVGAAGNRALLKDGLFCLFALLFVYAGWNIIQSKDPSPALIWFAAWLLLPLATLIYVGGLFRAWKTLGILAILIALGLSLHLYMPLASAQNPPMDWGNTQTKEGFLHVITRGQYAQFNISENVRTALASMSDPEQQPRFRDQLGTFLFDPSWKTSMASQFSLQFPLGEDDPTGTTPPPPEQHIPFALLGLLPLFVFLAFPARVRNWFGSSIVAMFFLTVVFLLIQWPELQLHDLWVKRVQYIQAHVLFAIWMGLGVGIVSFLLYALLPVRAALYLAGVPLSLALVIFPLWKEGMDPRHLEHLGASRQNGHRFGWEFGLYQLRGANGILLDELSRHSDPEVLLNDWAKAYLEHHNVWRETLNPLFDSHTIPRVTRSELRKLLSAHFRLSEEEQRWVEEAGMLAAFRDLSPREQEEALIHLHQPLPDWNYPPEMDQNAILFGGTDPGRFVPTYMVHSAKVRPDVKVVTQTALADSPYLETLREFYGDEIFVPDFLDNNRAFLAYANDLRLFNAKAFAQVMGTGNELAVSGAQQVNEINARLTRQMVEANAHAHSFYLEEGIHMPWMVRHLRPQGLIFKLDPEEVELTEEEVSQNHAFWNWLEYGLLYSGKPHQRNRYQRDLMARKLYSKLRMSQAWNFQQRGLYSDADLAMDQALRLYPANPEAVLRAIDMEIRQGNLERAEQLLENFLPHDPDNPQFRVTQQSLNILQRLDRQRQTLEATFARTPSGNTAFKLLQIYGGFEQRDKVAEMAHHLLTMEGLHPDFYPALAGVMQVRKNKELLRAAVERWVQKDPRNAHPRIELAVLALHDEDYPLMMRYLGMAIQLDPDYARTQIAQDPRFLDVRHWDRFQKLIETP